jgi:hypothetical protein
MNSNKNHWFCAKNYGYGWTPCSWQGWLSMAVYVLLMIRLFLYIDVWSQSFVGVVLGFFVPFILATFLLTVLCVYKGEKAQWRWGGEIKSNQ